MKRRICSILSNPRRANDRKLV